MSPDRITNTTKAQYLILLPCRQTPEPGEVTIEKAEQSWGGGASPCPAPSASWAPPRGTADPVRWTGRQLEQEILPSHTFSKLVDSFLSFFVVFLHQSVVPSRLDSLPAGHRPAGAEWETSCPAPWEAPLVITAWRTRPRGSASRYIYIFDPCCVWLFRFYELPQSELEGPVWLHLGTWPMLPF